MPSVDQSDTRFWLIIAIFVLLILLFFAILYLIIPALEIKNDIDIITTNVKPLQSKIDNKAQIIQKVENINNEITSNIEIVTEGKNRINTLIHQLENLRNGTQTDMNNFFIDSCNITAQLVKGTKIIQSFKFRDGPNVTNICKNISIDSGSTISFRQGTSEAIYYALLKQALGFSS